MLLALNHPFFRRIYSCIDQIRDEENGIQHMFTCAVEKKE